MKTFVILFISILLSTICFGQDLFYIGEKTYPIVSEDTYITKNEDYEIDVTIAQKNATILFILALEVMTPVNIRGKLIIYLNDGSLVSCVDRQIYDQVDDLSTTVYYLTVSEKKRIDDVGINLIRFSIKCNTCLDSSEEGTFTATRKPYKSKSYLFDFIEQH